MYFPLKGLIGTTDHKYALVLGSLMKSVHLESISYSVIIASFKRYVYEAVALCIHCIHCTYAAA